MKSFCLALLAALPVLLPCSGVENTQKNNLIEGCWTPGQGIPREYFARPDLQAWVANHRKRADETLGKSFRVPPADLYREFSRNGNRVNYENVYFEMIRDLHALSFGAYLTGEQNYFDKLDEALNVFCDYPTWILPAHDDKELANFAGKRVDIDLFSAENGHIVAAIYCSLGDRLRPETRERLRREIERRILTPFEEMTDGKRPKNHWLEGTNNWNPVCLAGVGGCILAVEENRERRLKLLAETVKYSRNYFKSFAADGYCSEGIGYYNYGFVSYLNLAAMMRVATGGRLDMLSLPESEAPSTFPDRIVICKNLYPAFADTQWNAALLKRVVDLRALMLGRKRSAAPAGGGYPVELLVFHFGDGRDTAGGTPAELAPYSLFPEGGVAVLRPGKAYPASRLHAVFKGGHNAEEHNHNDLGTYVIVADETVPAVIDAGRTVYTAATFSRDRYKNPLIGSYGHSVPLPAGTVQSPGKSARARLIGQKIDDESFLWQLDLRSAYPDAPGLLKLEREMHYSRSGEGSVTVTDRVAFAKPESYETAIITFGTLRQAAPEKFAIDQDGKTLFFTVECKEPFEVTAETLREEPLPPRPVTRIAVRLLNKAAEAAVTVRYTAQ